MCFASFFYRYICYFGHESRTLCSKDIVGRYSKTMSWSHETLHLQPFIRGLSWSLWEKLPVSQQIRSGYRWKCHNLSLPAFDNSLANLYINCSFNFFFSLFLKITCCSSKFLRVKYQPIYLYFNLNAVITLYFCTQKCCFKNLDV